MQKTRGSALLLCETRPRRAAANVRTCGIRTSGNRRGVLTTWSIFGMLLAGLCTALVINHLWISAVRSDSLRCAEAAALAAGHELLSDDLLRSTRQAFEQEGRLQRSRYAAVSMGENYRQTMMVPPIVAEDILYLHSGETINSSDSSERQASANSTTGSAQTPELVTVRFGATDRQSSIPLFLSGLTGIRNAVIGVQASVRLENSPAAFEPADIATVPLAPFCIPDDRSAQEPLSWSRLIEHENGADQFSWDNDTQLLTNGPDGLPEITLILSAETEGGEFGSLIPVSLCRNPLENSRLEDQLQHGISRNDLSTIGLSQIQFPLSVSCCRIPLQRLDSIADMLAAMKGRELIWCLSDSASADDSPSSVQLTRPVAARVVYVRMKSRSAVEVTLQPCILTTATAIMNPAIPETANRYIYSVRLVQ